MISDFFKRVREAFSAYPPVMPWAPSPPKGVFDIREEAETIALARPDVAAKIGRRRKWKKITGICLHQTACVLGERPGRWATLGAHIGITRAGKIIRVHDFGRVVYHGQAWNGGTIGIEIDGMYAGVEGDRNTFWRPRDDPGREPQELTAEAVAATLEAIRWICAEVEHRGGHVRALVAHRQSSRTRRHDPGSAIWQRIALPASAELGLSDGGAGFEIGGRPIPDEWDPARAGIRY